MVYWLLVERREQERNEVYITQTWQLSVLSNKCKDDASIVIKVSVIRKWKDIFPQW